VRTFSVAYLDQALFFQKEFGQNDISVKPAILQNQNIGFVQIHNSQLTSNQCKLNIPLQTAPLRDSGPAEWTYTVDGAGTASATIQTVSANVGLNFSKVADISLYFQHPIVTYITPAAYATIPALLNGTPSCSPALSRTHNNRQFDIIVGVIEATETWSWSDTTTLGVTAAATLPANLLGVTKAATPAGGGAATPAGGGAATPAGGGATPADAQAANCGGAAKQVSGTPTVSLTFADSSCAKPVSISDSDASVPRFYLVYSFKLP
jgi:hypothetical protein